MGETHLSYEQPGIIRSAADRGKMGGTRANFFARPGAVAAGLQQDDERDGEPPEAGTIQEDGPDNAREAVQAKTKSFQVNCTNCGHPSAAEYCLNCEQFRARLEKLRADQKEFWRDVRSGKRKLVHQTKNPAVGAHFQMQCRKYGDAAVAARLAKSAELPLAGQDAALPPGDRNE